MALPDAPRGAAGGYAARGRRRLWVWIGSPDFSPGPIATTPGMTGARLGDITKDARGWPRGTPVIAHPPCRAWGGLRAFAKPRPDEKQLALMAVSTIREPGGVLEHPRGSTLWRAAGLPAPGEGRDLWGGFTLHVDQWWWGHRAQKATWLYFCGIEPENLPPLPTIPKGIPNARHRH